MLPVNSGGHPAYQTFVTDMVHLAMKDNPRLINFPAHDILQPFSKSGHQHLCGIIRIIVFLRD